VRNPATGRFDPSATLGTGKLRASEGRATNDEDDEDDDDRRV
jgi:hypothetical protein